MPQQNTVVATMSVMTANRDGTPVMVKEGDVWAADDAFVADHPAIFGEIPARKIHTSAPNVAVPHVERATRAPGEARRGRPRNGGPR